MITVIFELFYSTAKPAFEDEKSAAPAKKNGVSVTRVRSSLIQARVRIDAALQIIAIETPAHASK